MHIGVKNELQFAPVFSVVEDHSGDHRNGVNKLGYMLWWHLGIKLRLICTENKSLGSSGM